MVNTMIESIVKCNCICCQEARSCLIHGRKPMDACDCHLYNENQRCDCLFCITVRNIRKTSING